MKLSKWFLSKKIIEQVFNISSFKLKLLECTRFAFGYRITFKQFAQNQSDLLPVLGGAIHIMINHNGKIISVSSTIQQGTISRSSVLQTSKIKALAIAKNKCGKTIVATKSEFVLVCRGNNLQPAYKIMLTCKFPYYKHTYLISAITGEIIDVFAKERCCFINNKTSEIKASAIVNTPDPNIPISDQVSKVIIKGLPNNQILKDEHFEMFTGIFAKAVSAKDDNTYCYGPRDSQFAAVSIYLALKKQIELYLAWD